MGTKIKKLRRKLKREATKMEQKQVQLTAHISDCEVERCNQCQNEIFMAGFRSGKMSAFHPKNPTKQAQWFKFETSFCKECGLERGKPAKVTN